MTTLNEELAKKQKITPTQRETLDKLYDYRNELLEQAFNEKNINILGKSYSDRMEKLEFALQENWNFPKDAKFHTHWNLFNQCTCPFYDNQERYGLEKIINCDCPFHKHKCGEKLEEVKPILTPQEFKEAMLLSRDEDCESAHINMDRLMEKTLASLGYEEGVEIYKNQEKWYT